MLISNAPVLPPPKATSPLIDAALVISLSVAIVILNYLVTIVPGAVPVVLTGAGVVVTT